MGCTLLLKKRKKCVFLLDRNCLTVYVIRVIRTFACKDTEKLANRKYVRRFSGFERQAQRKLAMLAAAETLETLKSPPGNRLEALKGDRLGQHSIRINGQWRICFEWRNGAAWGVEIVDYH